MMRLLWSKRANADLVDKDIGTPLEKQKDRKPDNTVTFPNAHPNFDDYENSMHDNHGYNNHLKVLGSLLNGINIFQSMPQVFFFS